MGTKRGTPAAVLDVPEDSYASGNLQDRQPAPAGALRRDFDAGASPRADNRSRARGNRTSTGLTLRWRGLPRTLGGRILAGIALVIAIVVVGGAALLARQFLTTDPRFLLAGGADIEIEGNRELTRPEALTVFAGDFDRNIFHPPLAERRADLERLPWVEHATVMRLLPNKLRVAVKERVPVAFVRQGSQIGLVDANGVLLDMPADAAGDPLYSFPVLTGIAAADPLSTRKARMELYGGFMKAMAEGGSQVTESLSEVDVTDPEDVKAVVTGGGADILVHFGDQDFLNRYRTFEEHVAEWRQAYPKLVSADMRYDNQIVLDAGTANSTTAAATGTPAAPAAEADRAAAENKPTATDRAPHPAALAPAARKTSIADKEAALARLKRQAAAGAHAAAPQPRVASATGQPGGTTR